MAIGVGFLVVFSVDLGMVATFFRCGGALALLVCLIGNFLSRVGFFAKNEQVSLTSAFSAVNTPTSRS